ncbi:MAG: hypothetical protein QNJ22_09510 [Desulfosarcinaceae bacterium]|nr:hypothetical protein [Desulfosarcinaceae bacterium]
MRNRPYMMTHHCACRPASGPTALWFCRLLLLASLVLCSFAPDTLQAAPPAAALQQRLADISLLHSQLQEKIQNAEALRENLYDEVKSLRSEVLRLKKEKGIRSFADAVEIPRIRYNLTLIREIKGYIANFNDKIRFLRIGSDKLYYLYHQAEDDLRIIHTLNDHKVEALQAQIEGVVEAYLPEAHHLLIDFNRIPYEPPKRIWEEVLRGTQ